jgi:hypothetical protein
MNDRDNLAARLPGRSLAVGETMVRGAVWLTWPCKIAAKKVGVVFIYTEGPTALTRFKSQERHT